VCLSSSLGESLESNLLQTISSISRVRSFHAIHTLGTMCNLSLRVWETHFNTLCPVLILKKKKKNLHVHVCLEILVDLRIMI
jgi:hypothetical protein